MTRNINFDPTPYSFISSQRWIPQTHMCNYQNYELCEVDKNKELDMKSTCLVQKIFDMHDLGNCTIFGFHSIKYEVVRMQGKHGPFRIEDYLIFSQYISI